MCGRPPWKRPSGSTMTSSGDSEPSLRWCASIDRGIARVGRIQPVSRSSAFSMYVQAVPLRVRFAS